jgi:hypothetical protein
MQFATGWVLPMLLALGAMLGTFVPMATADQPALEANDVASPISDSLVTDLIRAATGSRRTSTALIDECEFPNITGHAPVLENNAVLVGPLALRATRGFPYGSGCWLNASAANSPPKLNIGAAVTFNDALRIVFDRRDTRSALWFTAKDAPVRVRMMSMHAKLSVSRHGGASVVALQFRDKGYALLVITGPNLSADAARAYTTSADFKAARDFETANVQLYVPSFRLHRSSARCLGGCGAIVVNQSMALSLSEEGAGNAALMPPNLPMLFDLNAGLVYTKHTQHPRNVTIRANHPFYAAIVDRDTQRVLIDAFIENPLTN